MITAIIVNGEWHNDSCVEKCTEECEAKCPEVKSCNEEEIDCGPGARPENPFCDADRICVASNCNCKCYTYDFTLRIKNRYRYYLKNSNTSKQCSIQ